MAYIRHDGKKYSASLKPLVLYQKLSYIVTVLSNSIMEMKKYSAYGAASLCFCGLQWNPFAAGSFQS